MTFTRRGLPNKVKPRSATEPLVNAILDLQEQAGMTDEALARLAKKNTSLISHYRAGISIPSIPTLAKFAKGLGYSIQLIEDEPNKMKTPDLTTAAGIVAHLEDIGGFVHPCKIRLPDDTVFEAAGMSLRDHFAIEALKRIPYNPARGYDSTAQEAYRMADALLQTRTVPHE